MGVTAAVVGTVAAVNSISGGAITNAVTGGGGSGGGSSGGGSTGSGGSTTVSPTYDPYGPYRAGAADQLNQLLTNPALAMSAPGYQQQLTQGTQSLNRGMAASGQLASGQEQASLQSLGQNTFGSYYNSMLANLMQLSGASQSPAAAGQAQTQANLANQSIRSAQTAGITSGLGQLAGAANQLGGYWGGTNTNANNTSYFGGSGGGWVAQGDSASTASLFSDSSAYSSSAGWSM
jgi:hypothetical protein